MFNTNLQEFFPNADETLPFVPGSVAALENEKLKDDATKTLSADALKSLEKRIATGKTRIETLAALYAGKSGKDEQLIRRLTDILSSTANVKNLRTFKPFSSHAESVPSVIVQPAMGL